MAPCGRCRSDVVHHVQHNEQLGNRFVQHHTRPLGSPQLLLLLLLLLSSHSRQPFTAATPVTPAATAAQLADGMPLYSGAANPTQGAGGGGASASSSGSPVQLPVNAQGAPKGATPSYAVPTPDQTRDGVRPSVDCNLMSLHALMGISGGSACGGSPSTPQPNGSASSNDLKSQDTPQRLAELQKSSALHKDGLFTNNRGNSYCVYTARAAEVAHSNTNNAQFASIADARELPDIVDPACEDVYASEREGCPPRPANGQAADRTGAAFMDEEAGDGSSISSPEPDAGDAASAAASSSPSPSPGPDEALRNCSRKFTRVGSQPRSAAVILLKWRREYYTSREVCCQEQGNKPGCDCEWAGRTWDNLQPPKTWSRVFTDECDKGPSLNRAYYDMSGGRVTFHSKLRVPVPSGYSLLRSGSAAAATQSGGTVSTAGLPLDPGSLPPSLPANVAPSEPVETATSYLDPDGVDVYGWATLDAMRDEAGNCRDWCGDAVRQLGVNASDYNHIICMQHLGSPAICDTCTEGACINTCPADSGITTGCGCGTCYYAWGSQVGCSEAAAPGATSGHGGFHGTYTGSMMEVAGGEFLPIHGGIKMYFAHELGHNLGLTHTGGIQCRFNAEDGTIIREPSACKPDWYGDKTSFMGGGATMQLPAAIRYKVGWLPRNTLRTHRPGTERRYLLRPVTVRRPSWQTGRRVRWFGNGIGNGADALAIRVPLLNPSDGRGNVSSFSCPCNPMPDGDPASPGVCPACTEAAQKSDSNICKDGPCCTDPKCADQGLSWYYVELHMPFRNDYNSEVRGLAIRMMGELASNSCTSTRQVPTHVEDGQLKLLLDRPDPSGETRGSKFVDTFRGVTVVLETWTNTSAIVRITA